jgi:hypothetical protein
MENIQHNFDVTPLNLYEEHNTHTVTNRKHIICDFLRGRLSFVR